jgi:hypothetical protein
MRLSAHPPCLHETLHTAEAAGIEPKEVPLVGVGNSIDVGTELGPYISLVDARARAGRDVRRHGVKVDQGAMALAPRPWWES